MIKPLFIERIRTIMIVGNRDRCGRCQTRHGGNNRLCDVHGAVSEGCCPTVGGCNPKEWASLYNMLPNGSIVNTSKVLKKNVPSHYKRDGKAFGLDHYTYTLKPDETSVTNFLKPRT